MLTAQAIATGQHFWHLPRNASAHGIALDQHLLLNLWIALALLTLAHILLLLGITIKRRAAQPLHKLTLEYIPLAFLTLLFAYLAIRAQQLWAAQRYTGAAPEAMQVEVTGMQFAWYFRYPGADAAFGSTRLSLASAAEGNPLGLDASDPHSADDIVTSQLVLPANREVDLTLVSQDVIHGFAVPEMRLKQNAVPGQTTHIHFTPTTPGSYAIMCTQLCGMGHYRMSATMLVLPPAQFAAWLRAHEAGASR
jgi:cytochrome c oxidase subunit 2